MDNISQGRLRLTFLLITIAFAGIVWRLYSIQIVQGEKFKAIAQKQRIRIFIRPAQRGHILDASGQPLTENLPVPSLFAVPEEIPHPEQVAARLSALLSLNEKKILRQLRKKGRAFCWLKRQVSPQLARRIKLEKLPGIGILEETQRSYPKGQFLAPLLGFTSLDSKGLAGLELYHEETLQGQAGKIKVEATPTGMALDDKYIENVPPRQGHSLQLTIDPTIQYLSEKLTEEAVGKFQALHAQIIVIEIPSFKILAMAQYPTFDPNHFQAFPEESWRNLNISWTYEPGSTMKVFAIAAGLASGAISPASTFNDPGYLKVGKYTIRDAHHSRHGLVRPREILIHSCNVGAAQISLRTGQKNLSHYLQAFGFGKKTGIPLPGEEAGIFQSEGKWAKIRLANLAFGQGISVTPLQMAVAFAALVNEGRGRQPRLIDQEILPDSKIKKYPLSPEKSILPPSISRELLSYMEDAVTEGTGKKAAVEGYRIAGKTGTAQKAQGGRYTPGKFISSFIGTFPLPEPRWVALIVVDEPKGEHYGGTVAAPYFARLAQEILRNYGIPPSEKKEKG